MYFTQVAILALAAVAQAVPAVSRNVTPLESVTTYSPLSGAGDVSEDATFVVTLCSEQNFGGAASFTGSNNVPSNYNDVISSLRLDRTCTFWVDGGCNGNALVLNAGNYPQISADFNDKISALACN
uniref:Syncollin-related small protein A homeolog p n=1 Tax=Epichloe coenophiala TaxID=5047 RepID=A0A346R928_EPICN|nr:syncollin-related small protein A homeolog p [Epichloe coenophiala]